MAATGTLDRPAPPVPPRPADRLLLGLAALGALALLASAVGLLIDGDQITGAPAWLKPAKFAVSIAVYAATAAWVLRWVPGHRRAVRAISVVTTVALAAELVLIGMQVVRGTTSHFNTDTAFDGAVFEAMGGLVSLVFLAAAATAVLVWRGSALPPVLATGVRAGLLVSLLGMAEAGLMIANTSGGGDGGHTVGAPDGGPGLPLVGWSTEYGDLRVAHFVGLHALQLLLLAAWALHRWAPGLTDRTASRVLTVLAVGYAGLVVLLAWQAERELPLLRPDAPVLMVGLAGLLAVGAAVAALVRRNAR